MGSPETGHAGHGATRRPGRSVQKPRSAAPEPGRFHPAHRAALDVGRRTRHAGTGGSGLRGPLAGIPAGRGAVLRGHGWVVCPGAARSSAPARCWAPWPSSCWCRGLGLLAASGGTPTLWLLGLLLFVFFCGFNALEASQPSLVSRMAPPRCAARRWAPATPCSRWACLRAAPWAAPWSRWADVPTLFAVTGALCTVWLVLGWGLHPVPRRGSGGH